MVSDAPSAGDASTVVDDSEIREELLTTTPSRPIGEIRRLFRVLKVFCTCCFKLCAYGGYSMLECFRFLSKHREIQYSWVCTVRMIVERKRGPTVYLPFENCSVTAILRLSSSVVLHRHSRYLLCIFSHGRNHKISHT